MRAVASIRVAGRHAFGAVLEAALVAAILIVMALAFALTTRSPMGGKSALAGHASGPTISLTTSVARVVGGGSLQVNGWNFTPSSGGQHMWLWVSYPNDYCDESDYDPCHGFYAYPWVNDDGTFSVSYDNVLLQAGTGSVWATQWNAKNHKWVRVSSANYSVP